MTLPPDPDRCFDCSQGGAARIHNDENAKHFHDFVLNPQLATDVPDGWPSGGVTICNRGKKLDPETIEALRQLAWAVRRKQREYAAR